MPVDYSTTLEATDPYCLRDGEATALLRGHPWTRFVVLGDSVAEGLGDPVEGYVGLPWADRIAAELTVHRPDLAYLNLGRRNLRAADVRQRQLDRALEFRPDLALVTGGGYDALWPGYDADGVDAELRRMVSSLRALGADVITVGLFDAAHCPGVPERLRPGLPDRTGELSRRTAALAADLGAVHVHLTSHPAAADADVYSRDGLHGNARNHAIAAAEAVRRLGARLGNRFGSNG